MAITTGDLDFTIRFNLNNTPEDITFTDLQGGYDGGDVVVGILKITDPAGTILYENTNYAASTFGSPDISSATSTWSKTGIQLDLDSNNDVVSGTYTFQYKTSVNAGTNWYEFTATYNYNVSEVEVDMDSSLDCDASQLTLTDSTSYIITDYLGSTFSPTVTTRAWVIGCPNDYSATAITASTAIVILGSGTSYAGGNNLWTGTFSPVLTTTVSYTLADTATVAWRDDGVVTGSETWAFDWFYLSNVLYNSESVSTQCTVCMCNYIDCMTALDTRYQEAVASGSAAARRTLEDLKSTKRELTWAYINYIAARSCGEDTSTWCTRIQTLIDSTLDCCSDDATTSEEIIPISGSSTGSGVDAGSFITFGSGQAGLPVAARSGQTHVFNSTSGDYTQWDVYYNNGSSWVGQGNIKGVTGATASSTIPVLSNEINDVGDLHTNDPQYLVSYSLPQATLAPNDSYLEIVAYFRVIANKVGSLGLRIDGQTMMTHTINTSVQTDFILRVLAHRMSATTLTCENFFTIVGLPDSTETMAWTTPTITNLDTGGVIDIETVSDKDNSLAGDEITVKYLRVERHIKTT